MRKKEVLPFAITWINVEGIMISEINQTGKNKYCMVSQICRILKKKNQTLKNRE